MSPLDVAKRSDESKTLCHCTRKDELFFSSRKASWSTITLIVESSQQNDEISDQLPILIWGIIKIYICHNRMSQLYWSEASLLYNLDIHVFRVFGTLLVVGVYGSQGTRQN